VLRGAREPHHEFVRRESDKGIARLVVLEVIVIVPQKEDRDRLTPRTVEVDDLITYGPMQDGLVLRADYGFVAIESPRSPPGKRRPSQ
jgi:hypothetical protein